MKPSELLRESIDHLREVGWIKGSLGGDNHVGHCIRGSTLCIASGEEVHHSVERTAIEAVRDALRGFLPRAVQLADVDEAYYNDIVAKTIDDAIAPMEKAAAALEEQGL